MISFVALTVIDNYQIARILSENIPAIEQGTLSDEVFAENIRQLTVKLTIENPLPLIGFIGTLLVVLIAMATFRSPAVALMPDVTVKPLRSKANAIINLTGTAGGILVLALGILFGTSKNHYMQYTPYVIAVVAIMLTGLVVFIVSVKENKWAREMEEESLRLGIEDSAPAEAVGSTKLSRPQLRSLLLILASVALWYIGYNSITSKYSVYATNVLGFDFNLTLIIAQAAAIVSYIPVGIIASKIGRRKTILAGVTMLASAFLIGVFITPETPEFIMYPVFVLAGIGWATINVNSFPMVVELARGGDVGKYTGYYYTASMSAQIVAPILSGILYDLIGMRYVFFTFGAVFVALSFVTMFFVKHGDSKPLQKKSSIEYLDAED
jgi:MFS family permease